jgi:geranylgeranyl reductase family protein
LEKISTDILILGAGPAGATAALFLAKAGIRSTLVDKAVFPRDKICGDALSGKTVEVLRRLDPQLVMDIASKPTAVGSFGVNFVAPNGKSLKVPFKKDYHEMKIAPGFVEKRVDFDNWLFQMAKASSLVKTYEGMNLRKFTKTAEGYEAESQTGQLFQAKLILVCDGNNSQFAKEIASQKLPLDEQCYGLRAYYDGVSGLDEANFIELHFIKDVLPGYFWIFPMADGGANVGLGIRSDVLSKRKLSLPKLLDQIIAQDPKLQERFKQAKLQGGVKLCSLPLGSRKRPLSGDHYMLLGDAGALIDPFTGEGIGNAMMSGQYAAEQAAACLQQSRFDAAFLKQYDERLYQRLWSELSLSRRMQQLVNYPFLFNFVVNKASKNKKLQELISCMFEDLDLRAELKKPSFYFQLFFK